MRILIGWALEKFYHAREDYGLNHRKRFSSPEALHRWMRYGMNDYAFDEFDKECRQAAGERYGAYMVLVEDITGTRPSFKKSLSRYYYYTEFYWSLLTKN